MENLMKNLLYLFLIINSSIALSITPHITQTYATCANKYCVMIKGYDFENNTAFSVRENTSGSSQTIISGNSIYSRGFTTAEDKVFFPIQNLNLQNKWKNNGLCFKAINSNATSNEMCFIRTQNPVQPKYMGQTVESFSANQDLEHTSWLVRGNASPLQGGNMLKIMGNSWKQITYNYTVTPYTVLKFDFKSKQQEAEVNGIGFKVLNKPLQHFQVFGTQKNWKNQDYNNYEKSDDFRSYEIPIGEYFTGQTYKMFFTADEDNHVGQLVAFKNPRLEERPPLNHECSLVPLPEKIDCPNDPFFGSQWAADFMDFPYAWYYTKGRSRVGILDTQANINLPDFKSISKYSGVFASSNNLASTISHDVRGPTHACFNYNSDGTRAIDLYEDNPSYGYLNENQQHILDYPNIFINEYTSGGDFQSDYATAGQNSVEPKLEIAVKDTVDISKITIELHTTHDYFVPINYSGGVGSLDWDSLIFNIDYWNVSDDLNFKTYSLQNDFSNHGNYNNYRFYYIDRTLFPNFNLNSKAALTSDNVSPYYDGMPALFIHNEIVIKSNGHIIQRLKTPSEIHNSVTSCSRFFNSVVPSNQPEQDHGNMILSLLNAKSNNNTGVSAYCQDCNINYFDFLFHTAHTRGLNRYQPNKYNFLNTIFENEFNSLSFAIDSGVQIINRSGGAAGLLTCQEQQSIVPYHKKLDLCDELDVLHKREILYFSAAGNGNNYNFSDWPSNEVDTVIGVAGTDRTGALFSLNNSFGTNFVQGEIDFAAPGKEVLVKASSSGDYNNSINCIDSNFASPTDGYQRCSGTSFSTPILASLAALVRSINPLLPINDVKQIMTLAKVKGLIDNRYAIPRADKSVKLSLGKSSKNQLVNRLTPMFRLKTIPESYFPGQNSYLSTTIPQVAIAAKHKTYLVMPSEHTGKVDINYGTSYRVDSNSPLVSGYSFKDEFNSSYAARAPFFIFTGNRNPFNNEADDLVPLHHFGKSKSFGYNSYCKDLNTHIYTTDKNINVNVAINCQYYYLNYNYEGIQGYLLPNCPNGVTCYNKFDNNINDLQCISLKYSFNENSFALIMESETNKPMFNSYGNYYKNKLGQLKTITSLIPNASCLGYVFPNVDSDNDGVIDGMELVLKTDPYNPDTDNDNKLDGEEYPLAGIPFRDPLVPD